jgi:hypothetical protein
VPGGLVIERLRRWEQGPHAWIVVGVAAILALGATAWNLQGAWDAQGHAVDARERARAQLDDVRADLGQARGRLGRARADGARARSERAAAQLTLTGHRNELTAARADRDSAASTRDAKNAEIALVRACVAGANAALDALQQHDSAGTVAALRLVDGPCRLAQAVRGGPAPQYGFDFPDPFVLVVGPERYAYATNSSGGNIQMLHRQPDGTWATAGDALGQLPAWAARGRTWAPSVLARWGYFVLYYTVREAATGRQCVSRATSPSPTGPYVDTSTGPLVCGPREAIDPEAVVAADGTPVLLWKREQPAAVVAAPLASDGLSLAGSERELLHAGARWQDTNVEAPSMAVQPGGAWLLFSGGSWNGAGYATGVVHCTSALGPCDRAGDAPVLASHDGIAGPGGASVFADGPGTFGLAYHAYLSTNGRTVTVGYPNSRLLFLATIDLRSGRPVIVG